MSSGTQVPPAGPERQERLAASIAQATAQGRTNLSSAQLRTWTLLQIDEHSPYNALGAFRLDGSLDVESLQYGIAEVSR